MVWDRGRLHNQRLIYHGKVESANRVHVTANLFPVYSEDPGELRKSGIYPGLHDKRAARLISGSPISEGEGAFELQPESAAVGASF